MNDTAGSANLAATSPAPEPATLAIESISYDCAARVLTVVGTAAPARADQDVQVQVRSVERPRAPVWRLASTDARGRFVASGRYAATAGETDLTVRLGSVSDGNRVFSAKRSFRLECPAT